MKVQRRLLPAHLAVHPLGCVAVRPALVPSTPFPLSSSNERKKGVDNLFVFLMTFDYFQVPLEHQGRVLTWGIVGAILMRGVMIAFGVAVVTRFRWITIVFAGILLVSSYKLFVEADDDDHDLSQNTLVK